MADTGSKQNMAVETEGVDLEIATLISAVVDRQSPRKDALSKRVSGAGPQLRRVTDVEADEARSEINSLMDEVRREADARAAAETDAEDIAPDEAREPSEWLADAVIAKQTMRRHEELSKEARFDMPERKPKARSFTSNPFRKKAAAVVGAAAIPVVGALVSGSDDDIENDPAGISGAEPDMEIAGDRFAQDFTADNIAEDLALGEDAVLDATNSQAVDEYKDTEIDETDEIEAAPVALATDALVDADAVDETYIEHDLGTDGEDTYAAAVVVEKPQAVQPMSAAAMDAQHYNDDEGGLPIWLAMGIPVAAVSMAALVAGVNVVRENGAEKTPIEAASLGPLVTTYADAADGNIPAVAPPTEEIILANVPVVAPETELVQPDPVAAIVDAAAALPQEGPEFVEVIAPVVARPEPAPTVLASSAPLPSLPSTKPSTSRSTTPARSISEASSAPVRAGLNNIPSRKPQFVSATPNRSLAAPAVFQPKSHVPVRVFDGYFERGSAALTVNTIAANMGSVLNKSEQRWLARDMERVLDNEIDGRDVSLKSERGDRIGVLFAESGQELRRLSVARERGVAAFPNQMVLEGGWFAASSDVPLRATPSQAGVFDNRMVAKDTLIERMATVTDRYGDRWYLMGRDGVAVGYMSPADLILAGAAGETVGLPYNRRSGDVVSEIVQVYTRCRTVFVGPHGDTRQKMDVCRNAKGNWVDASDGVVPVQQANARPEPIVLASATGQSPELVLFEERSVRKQLAPKLVYARAGQVVKQRLADGRNVQLTLGEKYEATRIIPVVRLEALGRIEKPVRLNARWMRVPGGARLRATPDYVTTLNIGAIPAGQTVETIGSVEGEHGEDWILVGRNGVGFGYVQRQELMPLAGNTALRAVSGQHTAAVVDLVEGVTDCRSVAYSGDGLEGVFNACQQPDGQWALTAEPELRQLVDLEPSSHVAP